MKGLLVLFQAIVFHAVVPIAVVLLPGCSMLSSPASAQEVGESPSLGASPLDLPLSFASETIRIVVLADSIEVDGVYRFVRRPSETDATSLFYPFPRDSLLGGARMVSLEGREPDAAWYPLRFENPSARVSGVRWWIPSSPSEPHFETRAVYRQARLEDYGRYIVTTTAAWGLPLQWARFEIVLPRECEITLASFPFEPDDDGVYVYETTQFLPDRDIMFRWTGPH